MSEYIKPLNIGTLQLPHNVIQGPLAGYSCAPFRKLFKKYMSPAYCVSEMISAIDLSTKQNPRARLTFRDPHEGMLCYQISGNQSHSIAKACQLLTEYGGDIIDLNCGCPKTKIRKKQCGSALLQDLHALSGIITTMRNNTSLPITIKIRVSGFTQPQFHQDVARLAQDHGADAIIVHGRHWTQDYDVDVHHEQIQQVVDSVTIPVIANGDIHDFASLKKIIDNTGAAGVMIARAGTGKPWLYQQILHQAQGIAFETPCLNHRLDHFIEHIDELAVLETPFRAMLQSRKLLKYYFRQQWPHLPLQRLFSINDYPRYIAAIQQSLAQWHARYQGDELTSLT